MTPISAEFLKINRKSEERLAGMMAIARMNALEELLKATTWGLDNDSFYWAVVRDLGEAYRDVMLYRGQARAGSVTILSALHRE